MYKMDIKIYNNLLGTKHGLNHHLRCGKNFEIIEFFIKNTNNINEIDVESGMNSMMIVISSLIFNTHNYTEQRKIIVLLLNKGIDINYVNTSSNRSLVDMLIQGWVCYENYNMWLYDIFHFLIDDKFNVLNIKIKKHITKRYIKKILDISTNRYLPHIEFKIVNFLY